MDGRLRFVLLAVAGLLLSAGCSSSESTEEVATASINGGESQADIELASVHTPPVQPDPKVLLRTSAGEITIQLDLQNAPQTVDNFLAYVESGHYDQTIFHQVAAGYIVLGGGFTSDLTEKPTRRPLRNEARRTPSNRKATIAMAREPDIIDSAASQFFFNLADNESLDHQGRSPDAYGYCVFGKVIAGWDVVEKIAKGKVADTEEFEELPNKLVLILSAQRVE